MFNAFMLFCEIPRIRGNGFRGIANSADEKSFASADSRNFEIRGFNSTRRFRGSADFYPNSAVPRVQIVTGLRPDLFYFGIFLTLFGNRCVEW